MYFEKDNPPTACERTEKGKYGLTLDNFTTEKCQCAFPRTLTPHDLPYRK